MKARAVNAAAPAVQELVEQGIYRVATALNERLSLYWRGQPEQLVLHHGYQDGAGQDPPRLPAFDDTGFRVHSQSDEDGKLLFIFAVIGMGGRRCVDVGSGRPMGSNTTNLLVNWSWHGLCLDASSSDVAAADRWFRRHRSTMFHPPAVRAATVTPENIDDLVTGHVGDRPLDLLSLDIDSFDYWIWHRLTARPRVVVAEFTPIWEADKAVTVPADADLSGGGLYYGTSLAALVKLGRAKGYRFVGSSALGSNAFFVREDEIGPGLLPEASMDEALDRPWVRAVQARTPDAVRRRPWLDV